MSVKVSDAVWKHSKAKRSAKLVLLAIADRCRNDDGTGAWPSHADIATRTGLSEKAVRLKLAWLVANAELEIEARDGRTNLYTVLVKAPDEITEVAEETADGALDEITEVPQDRITEGSVICAATAGQDYRRTVVTVPQSSSEPSSPEETALRAAERTNEGDEEDAQEGSRPLWVRPAYARYLELAALKASGTTL